MESRARYSSHCRHDQPEQSDYAAAYATEVARDGKGNTKPTALHFTAANQQFLGTVEETRGKLTREWVEESFASFMSYWT